MDYHIKGNPSTTICVNQRLKIIFYRGYNEMADSFQYIVSEVSLNMYNHVSITSCRYIFVRMELIIDR